MKKNILLIILLLFSFNVFADENYITDINVNGVPVSCKGYVCSVTVSEQYTTAEITYNENEEFTTSSSVSPSKLETFVNNKVQFQIKALTKDGIDPIYTINVSNYKMKSDITLEELVVDENKVELFEKITVYKVEVPYYLEKVIVKGTPKKETNATCKKEEFSFPLTESSTSIQYPVTAENGKVDYYTINLFRSERPSTKISKLVFKDIDFILEDNNFNYTLNVPESIEKSLISVEFEDPNTTYKVMQGKNELEDELELKVGANKFKLIVTNEKAVDTYVFTINRLEGVSYSDANLKSLSVWGTEIDFKPEELQYELYFDAIPEMLLIQKEAENEEALVEVIGNENLKYGSIINIKVTVKNGINRIYTLILTDKKVEEKKESNTVNKLPVIISLIILVIVIIVLIILEIKDRKKKKTLKGKIKEKLEEIDLI